MDQEFPTNHRWHISPKLLLSSLFLIFGCAKFRGHYGGPQSFEPVPRPVNAADVGLPPGYRIEAVATGLTFPTGIAFDSQDRPFVIESGYCYGEVWTEPRLLRLDGGNVVELLKGTKNGPWTGLAFSAGNFYISEGGQLEGGRIIRFRPGGGLDTLVSGLPSQGDHHTNGIVAGTDGFLYFGQGVATNSAVVGLDNYDFGWLKRYPDFRDIPCEDVVLTGQNFETENPLTEDKNDKVLTGAFSTFGTATTAGQIIKGGLPCTGSIMRVPASGGKLELVAWGFRNPFGLAFSPDGRLFVTDNSYDVRGSRPAYGTGDILWSVENGKWYGWPDYSGSDPLNTKDYQTPDDDPRFVLSKHPGIPPKPAAILDVHSSTNGFDFSRAERFGYKGDAFVAQFGDMAPNVGRIYHPVGFKVVRVNVATGVVEDFAVNKGKKYGPASRKENGGLERPVAARFNNAGDALYVVDFGVLFMTEEGPAPKKGTGVIWKITKE